ncbi:hypothetical protein N8482_03070 [Chitinophagales bacterium]|nr:hypothetical protein [Chitinophagales bacterium]
MRTAFLHLFLVCFVTCCSALLAQQSSLTDSLSAIVLEPIVLDTALINAPSDSDFIKGDGIQTALASGAALNSLEATGWNIKLSGASGLALASINGLGAEYHSIQWNGLELNSVMNGYLDLQVLPELLSHQSQMVEQSGGTNAGSVIRQELQEGLIPKVGLKLAAGSFGEKDIAGFCQFRNKKTFLIVDLHYRRIKNNFSVTDFLNPTNESKTLEHAYFRNAGASISLGHKFERFNLKSGFWFTSGKRELPAPLSTTSNLGVQKDQHLRAFIRATTKDRKWLVSTGAQFEKIQYTLRRIDLDDKNRGNSWQLKARNKLKLSDKIALFTTVKNNFQWARVDAYEEENVNQNRADLQLKLKYKHDKLQVYVANSFVNIDWDTNIILPQFSITNRHDLNSSKSINYKLTVKRHFRAPTLNDLHWSPGGNRELEAEKGWSGVLKIKYQNKDQLSLSLSPFANIIYEKIVWLPGNAFWSPVNTGKIRSWGAAFRAKKKFTFSTSQTLKLGLSYHYNQSTNLSLLFPGDQSLNKQLIYSPRHRLNFSSLYRRNNFSLEIEGQYYGRVFTTRDHGSFLDPYCIIGSRISYDLFTENKNQHIQLQLAVNNLVDTEYYQVPFQALPGRSLLFTITYYLHQ